MHQRQGQSSSLYCLQSKLCLHFNCSMQKRNFWKLKWVKEAAKWVKERAKWVNRKSTAKLV